MALRTIRAGKGKSQGIEIKTDLQDLAKELRRFGKDSLVKAQVRAVNRGLDRATTTAKTLISRKLNLTSAMTLSGLTKVKAQVNGRGALLLGKGKMLALTKLKGGLNNPKQQQRGVKVAAEAGKKTLLLGHFLARMPSGHVGVFVRARSSGGGGERVPRLPIMERKNPSIAHTLLNDKILLPLLDRFEKSYLQAFEKNMENAIARANRRIKS